MCGSMSDARPVGDGSCDAIEVPGGVVGDGVGLRRLGECEGFMVYFNPVNGRLICERESDVATALLEYPSLGLVHGWGVSQRDLDRLLAALPAFLASGVMRG